MKRIPITITVYIDIPDEATVSPVQAPIWSDGEARKDNFGNKLVTENQMRFLEARGISVKPTLTLFDASRQIADIKNKEELERTKPMFDDEPLPIDPILDKEPLKKKRGRPRKEVQ